MSRFILRIKASFFRTLQTIFTYLDIYFSRPIPQRASFTRTIPSTVGPVPGKFDLLFYIPQATDPTQPSSKTPQKLPLLINFHGGGFTIGHAHDDARFATTILQHIPSVICSVNYRLAPKHPFPTGINDCVSAVLYLWSHADELNLDISRTAFSGFSAGGNLAYAVAIKLHEEIERLKKEDAIEDSEIGRLTNLLVFYGSVDWTQTRAERDATNPKLIPVIPPVLFRVFDESYLPKIVDMADPLLSPGLAADEVLKDALPERVFMVNCGGDQLLAESEKFRARLKGLGKEVDGYVVENVGHGWDKNASFGKGNVKRDEAYRAAAESLKESWKI